MDMIEEVREIDENESVKNYFANCTYHHQIQICHRRRSHRRSMLATKLDHLQIIVNIYVLMGILLIIS